MKLSRGLGLLAALGVCWFSAVGCDDGGNAPADGNDASSAAGAGGSAGKGTGGSAGKATGGSSGSSAAPGAGGSGGVPPGSGGGAGKGGGAGGSNTGTGGAAGAGAADAAADSGTVDAFIPQDGSAPGTAEAGLDGSSGTGAKSCTYGCETDDDCLVDTDATMKCHPTKKRCFDPTATCESNDDCVGFVSIWFPGCIGDDDCFLGDVCVDAGGYGLCATPPDPVDGTCLFPDQEPLTRKRFGPGDGGTGDAGTIAVCGATSGRCTKGQCITGCSSDPQFCTGDFGSSCNEVSGMCECAASSECTASGVSACNQQNHLCECASNADCTSPGLDTCVGGSCGCSSANACPTSPYKNAVSVCD